MTQGAQLLVRMVAVSGSPALLAVVARRSAIVTLQTILLKLVTRRASAGLLHGNPTMLAGPESLAVRHGLALVADLAGIGPVAQVTHSLSCALSMPALPRRLLVRGGWLLGMALLAVTLLVALRAGTGLRCCRFTMGCPGPTLRVRHRQLMATVALALAVAEAAVRPRALAGRPVTAKPVALVRGRNLMLMAGAAELFLVTKIAIPGLVGNALTGMQALPTRRVGHLHTIVATAASLRTVTAKALTHRLEGVAPVSLFPGVCLVVRRLPALMTGTAGLDGVTLAAALVLLALSVGGQELGIVRRRQALGVAMLTGWQGMAGRAGCALLRRGLPVLGQPVERMLGVQLMACVAGLLLMTLTATAGVLPSLLGVGQQVLPFVRVRPLAHRQRDLRQGLHRLGWLHHLLPRKAYAARQDDKDHQPRDEAARQAEPTQPLQTALNSARPVKVQR